MKFNQSEPKTFYFDCGQGGTISRSSLTFKPGDPEVVIKAMPYSGYEFVVWTYGDRDEAFSYDPDITINDLVCEDLRYPDGTLFVASFREMSYPTNTLSVSNVRYSTSTVSATVTSTYTTDVDLNVDLDVVYDYSSLANPNSQWDIKKNVTDSKEFKLAKGKKTWEISLKMRYDTGSGSGAYDAQIDNIRWSFSGNNGAGGNGTVMGDYRYYFDNTNGTVK